MVNLYGYQPPEKFLWQGRHDGPEALRLHEVVHCTDVQFGLALPKHAIVLIGFASDEGVKRNLGRPGAADGPLAWRKALANLPVPEGLTRPIFDAGDITCLENDLEQAQAALGLLVALVLEQGGFPFVCGGGHEVAWGQFLGIAEKGFDRGLGIVNLDAHYDLRPVLEGNKGTSGTTFSQMLDHQNAKGFPFYYACAGIQPQGNTIALHQKARTLDVLVIPAEEIDHAPHLLEPFIDLAQHLYFTICLDVFNSAFAPGVSAPQVLGITPTQALPLIRKMAGTGKLFACNIAELSPSYDRDQMTARLAAALTLEILRLLPSN
ncbi:MAG: formimidoylglutamase [Parachlamydiales bacterium]